MKLDICCIGHITLDKIVTPEKEVYMPGGTSYYFAHGISGLLRDTQGKRVPSFKLITSLGGKEMSAVDDIRAKGIDVEVIPSKNTVFFENIYGKNQNNRKQRVRAKADPFTTEKLKDVKARYIILGSLLADDFSLDVIKYLSQRGTLVVDAQGYLREVKDEKVYACDWKDKSEALRYIDILKVNEHEIEVLTGLKDPHAAAMRLHEWGVKEVLLTLGSYGSIIYDGEHFYEIPGYPPHKMVDATGCGDTYAAGFLYAHSLGMPLRVCGEVGSIIAAKVVEVIGTKIDIPRWRTAKEEIRALIAANQQ